jgi:hypothetical protein
MIAAAIAAPPALAENAASPLTGVWRMTTLEVPNGSGELGTVPYSGQVIFTESGIMAVQAMNPDAAAPDSPYTLKGYEAYYGPVTVNEAENTFTITIESAAVRDLIGQSFTRAFEVSGDQLILKPTNPEESWRVTYQRG